MSQYHLLNGWFTHLLFYWWDIDEAKRYLKWCLTFVIVSSLRTAIFSMRTAVYQNERCCVWKYALKFLERYLLSVKLSIKSCCSASLQQCGATFSIYGKIKRCFCCTSVLVLTDSTPGGMSSSILPSAVRLEYVLFYCSTCYFFSISSTPEGFLHPESEHC